MAVTKRCRGSLAPACVGDRVDLDHEVVREYLGAAWPAPAPTGAEKKGAVRSEAPPAPRPEAGKRKGKRATKAPAPAPPPAPKDEPDEGQIEIVTAEDIERYAHLSLTALTRKFGTATAFKDWLAAHKTIEDIREKRLKNDEAEGRLIPREPVRTHVFGAINAVNIRLLRDAPKTLTRRLYALARSGAPVEEAETTAREILGSLLKPMKTNAARVLRNVARGEASEPDDTDDES